MIPDAARIRRQLAGRLAEIGDREGALTELRQVHDTFLHMGAKDELQKTRIQFKELDARPPVIASEGGEHGPNPPGEHLPEARTQGARRAGGLRS